MSSRPAWGLLVWGSRPPWHTVEEALPEVAVEREAGQLGHGRRRSVRLPLRVCWRPSCPAVSVVRLPPVRPHGTEQLWRRHHTAKAWQKQRLRLRLQSLEPRR